MTSKMCLSSSVCRGGQTHKTSILDKQNSKYLSSNACTFGRGFEELKLKSLSEKEMHKEMN